MEAKADSYTAATSTKSNGKRCLEHRTKQLHRKNFRHSISPSTMMWSALLILPVLWGTSEAQKFFVLTPRSIRLNADENIALAVDGVNQPQHMSINIEDFPGRKKNISVSSFTVVPGNPKTVKIRIEDKDFPPGTVWDPTQTTYVSLRAVSGKFNQEVIIPVSFKSRFVFLMTDKPVYSPQQGVNFRIFQLNEHGLPSKDEIRFLIKNPNNVVVRETTHYAKNSKDMENIILTPKPYIFAGYPLLGLWTATVLYGPKFQQSTTVHFELQEYVLPTFTVTLESQDVIVPHDEAVHFSVEAKYVYGKEVQGYVTIRVGIKSALDSEANLVSLLDSRTLDDGRYSGRITTEELKRHLKGVWFPEIQNFRFVIEATVTDIATGDKETVLDAKGIFSESPFTISFANSLKDFRPGLVSVIQGEVRYRSGQPAKGIKTVLKKAVANDGQPLKINNYESVSDDDGHIWFEVHPQIFHTVISVTVETDDPKYKQDQATGHHVQKKYESRTKAYIAIFRRSRKAVKPGDLFSEQVYFTPKNITDIYSMVIARGRILLIKKLTHGSYEFQNTEFIVTHKMTPSFRLFIFAEYNGEIIADTLRVEVEKECDPAAQVEVKINYGLLPEPAAEGDITIEGTPGTRIALMAVDKAVYAISKRDVFTKSKMFKILEEHDLGCGAGGGLTTPSVFQNAGLLIMTNNFKLSPDGECNEEENLRQKRSALEEKLSSYDGILQKCCMLGFDKDLYSRGCSERAAVVRDHLKENDKNCSSAFYDCCIHLNQGPVGRSSIQRGRIAQGYSGLKFIKESLLKQKPMQRTDFRETWGFDDLVIRLDGKVDSRATLPHSITTWVVHAVAVSETDGICIAEPAEIQTFKKIFLQLGLPYSVVRNEQIEVPATLYNYGHKKIEATLFMYGVRDLCSGAQAGEMSETKQLQVEANSAQTVAFPVVPLKEGEYDINVVAVSLDGSDSIMKKLKVVPEGEVVEESITVILDPSNQQNRKERDANSEGISDSIVENEKLQVTAVKLNSLRKGEPIPGTETCVVSAVGDQFGPTVETSLGDPEKLLEKPSGCAEQNMIRFAPTLYTMNYLKETNQITPEMEEKGYDLIRKGYDWQMTFRKNDGSFGAWKTTPPSTWLTAFVTKVFCQANKLIRIDEKTMCSGVQWVLKKQHEDGSFIEQHPVYHKTMMGSASSRIPMTAFILIMLEECDCNIENSHIHKARALSYIEDHFGDVNEALPLSIIAYALALSGSALKEAGNNKLLSLGTFDEGQNTFFWKTGSDTGNVEATAYGLLTQLKMHDLKLSNSIVNWLNRQRLASGSFDSTQDTIVALQALSEYAIRARMPGISLMANITSSNDINVLQTMAFNENNALVLQEKKFDNLGDMLFIKTVGHGIGLLSVKLRYNVPHPPEKLCRFDIKVNVTEEKQIQMPNILDQPDIPVGSGGSDVFEQDLIRGVSNALAAAPEEKKFDVDPRNRMRSSRIAKISSEVVPEPFRGRVVRIKRNDNQKNSKIIHKIKICVRYYGDHETEMAIIDAGIFSGFKPFEEDLKNLQNFRNSLIDKYELSNRGIVFYLEKIPYQEPYCFDFRIVREYFVGNTRSSVIKVYDYYNPNEACSVFYSPDHNSPLLRKLCSGGICQCAEGGCPPEEPFTPAKFKDGLKNTACEDHDYVWQGKVVEPITRKGGFLHIKFQVTEVLKAGVEKDSYVKGGIRVLMAKEICKSAELVLDQEYVIMGKDGEKFEEENKSIQHRYILDKTATIFPWEPKKQRSPMQRALKRLHQELRNGCDL